jgi:hypothetical protein
LIAFRQLFSKKFSYFVGNRPKYESALTIHMDSITLSDPPAASLLSRYHHIAHFTGTALRIASSDDGGSSREIAIEGYSSSMVELAKLALQQALSQQLQSATGTSRGGGGALVQQAAVASTSEGIGAGGEMPTSRSGMVGDRRRHSKGLSPPPLEEDAVSSTTECEPMVINAAIAILSQEEKPQISSKG